MTWATDRLNEILNGNARIPPVTETLQMGLLDHWEPGRVTKTWQSSPALLQFDGSMFGGYIAALADQTAAFATMTVVPDAHYFRTIGLSVQFFKLSRFPKLSIEGRVVSQSKSLISVEVDFSESSRLIARASVTQFLTMR